MPVLSSKARQAAMLATLIGCALALGPARETQAASCHVADRPVFGLSSDQGIVTIEGTVIVEAPTPLELERRCPSSDPERPPMRPSASSGDPPLLFWIDPIGNDPSTQLCAEPEAARPIRRCSRIDRPPQSP
ncbi:hypothetical protein [Tautonia marina]|uniref:hypothetical protein n=1 Tax=Tautonia marina TaxID=2653855 RepID=UPI0012609D1E|nr:hypothetical protein [Tautonia marina]